MSAWPHVRAGLIALHLFAITAMALPSAGGAGLRRASWSEPTVQDEFATWTARLNALGWQGTSEQLQDTAFTVVRSYEDARGAVLAPFDPYFRYCGTWQSWRMFVAPHRYPARLHIDVQQDGVWRPVYEARSGTYTWRARQLDHDRFRSAIFRYAWPQYRRGYRQFVTWLTAQARTDFPEARRLRVRFYKARTPSPSEVRDGHEPDGRFVNARVVDLAP